MESRDQDTKFRAILTTNKSTHSREDNMRFFSKLSIAVAVAALVFGAVTPVKAQETIRCAYPFWFGFAPTQVAAKLGYFAEENLEVTWVFDNDRANVYPALDTNQINCTMRTIGEHMSRPLNADSNLVVIGVIDVGATMMYEILCVLAEAVARRNTKER